MIMVLFNVLVAIGAWELAGGFMNIVAEYGWYSVVSKIVMVYLAYGIAISAVAFIGNAFSKKKKLIIDPQSGKVVACPENVVKLNPFQYMAWDIVNGIPTTITGLIAQIFALIVELFKGTALLAGALIKSIVQLVGILFFIPYRAYATPIEARKLIEARARINAMRGIPRISSKKRRK